MGNCVYISPVARHNGVLAQLVERLNGIEEVSGSNPLCSTSLKMCIRVLMHIFLSTRKEKRRSPAKRGVTAGPALHIPGGTL